MGQLIILIVAIISCLNVNAGTGAWPKGPDVFIMKPNLLFSGGDIKIMTGDTTDPTSGTIDAELGSAYIQKGTGTWYKKQDNGDTTNWQNFIFGALGTSGIDECLPRWDGAGTGVLQNSLLCVDDAGAGTGLTALDIGDLQISGSTIATSGVVDIVLATSSTGNIVLSTSITVSKPLKVDGAKNIISGDIDLTSEVTGILPIANGGTGTSVASGATLPSIYDSIVGTGGFADIDAAVAGATAGDSIGYLSEIAPAVTASQTITKTLGFTGGGNGATVNGNVIFAAGSDGSSLNNLRVDGTIIIDAGVKNLNINAIWLSIGNTVIDNSGNNSNLIIVVVEE
jgi:hypothetical protein